MRDPSLVASKADIRQQAISGGELPGTEVADAMPPTPRGWLLDDSKMAVGSAKPTTLEGRKHPV